MIDLPMLDKALDQIKMLAEAEAAARQCISQQSIDGDRVGFSADWNQSAWRTIEVDEKQHRCNTSMCLAGWVAELDPQVDWKVNAVEYLRLSKATHDAEVAFESMDELHNRHYSSALAEKYSEARTSARQAYGKISNLYQDMTNMLNLVVPVGNTEHVDVETWATDRLGLTGTQASELFVGHNDIERIERVLNALRDDPSWNGFDDSDEDDDDEDYSSDSLAAQCDCGPCRRDRGEE
jgi:hypothetical protein